MIVTPKNLRLLFENLMNKMEEDGIFSLEINNVDYYWLVLSYEWTNFQSEVKPAVGSLIDDWDSLQKVLSGEQIPTYLDFDRLAAILRAISERVAPSKSDEE